VSRRHDLERRRRGLADIRGIMNSMKTLAYMETRKLAHFLDAQRAVVLSMEEVAADLLRFHPDLLPPVTGGLHVNVLIGTERGFCGDMNHRLLARLEQAPGPGTAPGSPLIAVGRKLHGLLAQGPHRPVRVDGASVAEDVPDLLSRIVAEVRNLQDRHGELAVNCLYQEAGGRLVSRQILPPFVELETSHPTFAHPPLLNLPAAAFLAELAEHYLFATLHEILYTALAAENRERVTHLETAVNRLDEQTDQLERRMNGLRQEEIIEEIEVILLNAGNLERGGAGRARMPGHRRPSRRGPKASGSVPRRWRHPHAGGPGSGA